MSVSAVNITKSLGGIDFPASKEVIIEHAKSKKASDEVMEIFEQMPDKEYENITDVEHEFSQIR